MRAKSIINKSKKEEHNWKFKISRAINDSQLVIVTGTFFILLFLLVSLTNLSLVSGADAFTGGDIPPSFTGENYRIYGSSLNPQFSQPGFYAGIDPRDYWANFNRKDCKERQDVILTIPPGGCSPAVIRSDLLEEQDVPVFCKVSSIQVNPLIDITKIRSIHFKGDYGKEIAGISYYPARAAVKSYDNLVGSPVVDNLGYLVVKLRRTEAESKMPDFIEANITAIIDYDSEGTYGIGEHEFFLTELDDRQWENQYKEYGFWQGKGFIRAEAIDDDSARISIYKDARNLEASVNVKKGETSGDIYLGGYYCAAGMNIQVQDIDYPVKKALINFDDEETWVSEGSRFLDGKCRVTKIFPDSVGGGYVDMVCDNKKITLSLSGRKISFEIEADGKKQENQVEVGEKILTKEIKIQSKTQTRDIYLAYAGKYRDSKNEYYVLVSIPQGIEIPGGIGSFVYYKSNEWKNKGWLKKTWEIVVSHAQERFEGVALAPELGPGLNENYTLEEDNFYNYLIKELVGEHSAINDVYNDVHILVGPATWDTYGITVKGVTSGESVLDKDSLLRESYDKAVQSYGDVFNFYPEEKPDKDEKSSLEPYAAEALYNAGDLSGKLGLTIRQREFFEKLIENYPGSSKARDAEGELNNVYSGLKNAQALVYINNQPHFISLSKIEEPSYEDLGAEVEINYQGKPDTLKLRKDVPQRILDTDYYIYLSEVKDGEVKVKYDKDLPVKQDIVNVFAGLVGLEGFKASANLEIGKEVILDKDFSARLVSTNLEKEVKVKIIPKAFGTRTESDLTFKIGIEKRAIKLSPEKTREMIDNLGETIKKWTEVNKNLGKVVEGMKGACFATSAMLVVKNLINGYSGKSMARNEVMTEAGGWNEKCRKAVADKTKLCGNSAPSSMPNCLLECNDKIEASVNKLAEIYDKENEILQDLGGKPKKSDILDIEGYVDSESVKKEYCERYIKGKTGSLNNVEIELKGVLGKKDLIEDKGIFTEQQIENCSLDLSDMKLLRLRQQAENDDFLTGLIEGRMGEELASTYQIKEIEKNKGIITDSFGAGIPAYSQVNVKYQAMAEVPQDRKEMGKFDSDVTKVFGDYINGVPVLIGLVKKSGDIYSVKQIYYNDDSRYEQLNNWRGQSEFTLANSALYKNPFKEKPKVEYHERAPYQGLPALVPFDFKNGWYVKTDYVLSGFGKPFDESGRAVNFWICNVGKDGLVNYKQGDECRYYNLGSTADLGFPGLDASDSSRLVRDAQSALQQAANQYRQGKKRVSINGEIYDTTIAADSTSGECTDFMSPQDCSLMFNVCDPVICPASRCDFGGQFRVANVIQSGIIGSLVLCLPNANEGIYVPICLSGVHAGIEGYLSILNSTQQCLKESLETGRNIGICDEIKSIYLCEFFWRQAAPLMDVAIPRIFEAFLGQGARGGGEYLTVNSAWENAKASIDYFKNEYAVNAMKAFNARSTAEIGGEVCKSFISARYPNNKDFLDNLLEPDSPVQYHAWFSENTLTTATVPPTSHYKVYYHIYAGKDIGANYVIYLKNPPESNYIHTMGSYIVGRGYIERGQQVDEAADFTSVSGYTELCVNINGQEECGFKQVSTSFALDYISTQYSKEQIESEITTSKQCVSGTNSLYSFAQPNLEAGAEEALNPEVYKRGIIRVCSTSNPGLQTSEKTGSLTDRWQRVGYCDDKSIGCWIDTQSVENVLKLDKNATAAGLGYIQDNYKNYLNETGIISILTPEDSESILEKAKEKIREIEGLKEPSLTKENISLKLGDTEQKLDELSQKGPTSNYQAQALLWKGKIFGLIAERVYSLKVLEKKTSEGSSDKEQAMAEGSTNNIEADERGVLEENIKKYIINITAERRGFGRNKLYVSFILKSNESGSFFVTLETKEEEIIKRFPNLKDRWFNLGKNEQQKITLGTSGTHYKIDNIGSKFKIKLYTNNTQGKAELIGVHTGDVPKKP